MNVPIVELSTRISDKRRNHANNAGPGRISDGLGSTSAGDQFGQNVCGAGSGTVESSCQRVGDPCCRAWFHFGKYRDSCRWAYNNVAWSECERNEGEGDGVCRLA